MEREIQHECDWHFCNGPLLVLTSATNRKDLKANAELKAIPDLSKWKATTSIMIMISKNCSSVFERVCIRF